MLTVNTPNLTNLEIGSYIRNRRRPGRITLMGKMLAVTRLPRLVRLSLNREQITPVNALTISKLLPNLEELEVSNGLMKDDSIRIIGNNLKHLTKLIIPFNFVTGIGCSSIAELNNLRSLNIGKFTDHVANNPIQDTGLQKLAIALT